MADPDDIPPGSPPIVPKGSYSINWDEIDEDTNPFQTKSKVQMAMSPDKNANEVNPFQTKSKICSSPPKVSHLPDVPDDHIGVESVGTELQVDNSLATSAITNTNIDTNDCSAQNAIEPTETIKPSETNSEQKLKTKAKVPRSSPTPCDKDALTEMGSVDMNQDGGAERVISQPQVKKAAIPKKSNKKPKARSKFKPPENFGVKNTDADIEIYAPPPPPTSQSATANGNGDHSLLNTDADIEIYAPPPPPTSQSATANENGDHSLLVRIHSQEECERDQEAGPKDSEPISVDSSQDLPNQMPALDGANMMMASVCDFGAGDMPGEANEGCVPRSEAFDEDDAAWDMLEKLNNAENMQPGRESLMKFDPLMDDQVADKATPRVSVSDIDANGSSDKDLLLMNTPPTKATSSRAVSRHPAARALQEQVEGDGGPREAHVVDKMLFSPVQGEEQRSTYDDERYFDAQEYPVGHNRQMKKRGESEVERLNSANIRKHGTSGSDNKDSIVQIVQVLKYSQSDWNKMKQESELEYNARILQKEREWSKKLADRDKRISHLDEQVLLLRSSNDDMRCVVAEFEKTISQLQAEKEKTTTESQNTYEDVVKERDQALDDLQSVETAFSDLHQRYERTKGVVETFKKNEDILKKCVQDYQVKLKTAEDKAIHVRQMAEDKLDIASQEMDKLRRSTTSEVVRLEAALKKSELKIHGLDRGLEQKVKENDELTAICDELIAKVGGE